MCNTWIKCFLSKAMENFQVNVFHREPWCNELKNKKIRPIYIYGH